MSDWPKQGADQEQTGMSDWPKVEAEVRAAGWTYEPRPSRLEQLLDVPGRWGGPCPVSGESYCTFEESKRASDGVYMECHAPTCLPVPSDRGAKDNRYWYHRIMLAKRARAARRVRRPDRP